MKNIECGFNRLNLFYIMETIERREKMKNRTCIIGSISHGTMRNADLLDSFAHTLRYLAIANKQYEEYESIFRETIRYRDFLIEHEDKLYKPHHKKLRESIFETVSYIIEDLIDALNEFAPLNYYFGSHPGDGADYGFWPSEDL